jgi:hypothetical protein
MNPDRKTAVIVGIFFIAATIAGILSIVFGPEMEGPDYLNNLSANESQAILGALFEFTMAVMIVGIPIYLYSVLKKYNTALAIGYIVFRVIEVVFFIFGAVCLLMLLTLSRAYVIAEAPDTTCFQTIAVLLLAVREWGGGVFSTIIFSLSALILNYILYRSRLLPRWLSAWGIIGATLYLGSGILPFLGHETRSTICNLMEAPLALEEMVFAIWLIVKGFNQYEIAPDNVN